MHTSDKKDIAFALISTVGGLLIVIDAFSYAYNSSVFLRGLGIAIVLMGLAYLYTTVKRVRQRRQIDKQTPSSSTSASHAVLVFALVFGCMLLIPVLGFLLAFSLFIYFAQVLIARKHRNLYLVYAISLSLFIFIVFFGFLGVSLPESLLPVDQSLKFF